MSSENWPDCIAFTLQEEGGLCDTPGDPGGLTNFGISQRAYPGLDIAHLTRAQAETIYRRDYWNKMAGDSLPAGIDLMVFDFGVNAGIAGSARLLQRTVEVAEDGLIGPMTLLAIRGMSAEILVNDLHEAQLTYYRSLQGWAEFGRGWGDRTDRRRDEAIWMVK
ncbi:MAG: glycoside hydrolase family 108 protein [Patescibacteria group bacterium]|nr:glycoside hydrolase family 108 protein [Patescibacteria group bacterium]